MAENYLITGYWGEPHVTAENDRGINAAIFGAGRLVLPVGEQFRAEYIGNNTVRIYDGKLIDNGAVAGIPAGEYVDLVIPEAGQGKKRNDLIIFQYSQDSATLIESGVFMVLSGEETSGIATDPALSQQDILTNEATLDQMALWRVPVSGTVISAPVQLFEVSKNMRNAATSVVEAISSDGVAYSATVPGVTELFAGLEVTIIPNMASATTAPTLDINGLGAKNIRLPVSTNTAILAQPETETYFVDGRPVRLMYDPKYAGKGSWVAVHKQRQSGSDIYGTVPIENGGTGSDNAAEARANLGAAPSGYGLGEYAATISDLNSLTGGLFKWDAAAENRPFDYGTAIVVGRDGGSGSEICIGVSGTYKGVVVVRTKNSAGWIEEYINPPMVLGTEYRTTERHNGKPVYIMAFNAGSMPNNNTLRVTLPSKIQGQEIIHTALRIKSGSNSMQMAYGADPGYFIEGTNLVLNTTGNFSAYTATAVFKYTKN